MSWTQACETSLAGTHSRVEKRAVRRAKEEIVLGVYNIKYFELFWIKFEKNAELRILVKLEKDQQNGPERQKCHIVRKRV